MTESYDERYTRAVENARAARAWQEDYEPDYSDDVPTLPEPEARSRQFWIVGFLFLSLVTCVLGSVMVPGGLGFLAGYQQLQAQNHELAIQHFNRGLGFLAENYPQLAYTEFEIAVKFDGSYAPAQDKLRELQSTIGAQETPGAQSEDRVAATLFGDAGTLISKQQWSDAITRLEQLQTLNPNYRAAEVNAMLYKAYVADGKEAVAAGQIELARERFGAALGIQNGDAEIVRQRDLAALYLEGQQAAGFDWQTAIQKFSALYLEDSTYYDVKQRLVDAYSKYGAIAFRQNAWCLAVKEYDGALAIVQDASLSDQRAQAMTLCKQAISATPTPAPVAGAENFLSTQPAVTDKACDGTGDVSGTVRDMAARPMAGVGVGYYADGINLMPTRTNNLGQYQLILGKDPGTIHVVVLGPDGSTPAGLAADLDYVGGNNAGCHVLIDWQLAQ